MSTGPLPIRTRLRPLPAPAPRRGVRAVFRGPLAGALCGLLLASGCGVLPGGGDDESPVMTWAPLRTTGTNAPGMTAMARAYEQWVNSGGGIGGRELRVLVCDEGNESVAAAECARRAVREKAVAVVGSYSEQDAAIFSPISLAGIPYLGGYGITHEEFVNPDSYPVNGGLPALIAAQGAQLAPDCDRVALVRPEGVTGDTWPDLLRAGLRGAGGKGEVVDLPVPVSSSDYTPQAGQVLDRLAPAPAARRCVSVALGDSTAAFVDSFRRVAPSGGTGTGGAEAGAGEYGGGGDARRAGRLGAREREPAARRPVRGRVGPVRGRRGDGLVPARVRPALGDDEEGHHAARLRGQRDRPGGRGRADDVDRVHRAAPDRGVPRRGPGDRADRARRPRQGHEGLDGWPHPHPELGRRLRPLGHRLPPHGQHPRDPPGGPRRPIGRGTGHGGTARGATGDAREALESEPTGSGGRE
ncbi:substrate-binding protein [Streptomyces sp. DfronAA-171]|nr:substrate-binding protein [Streptomyces sp. DfronAA-171]